MRALIIWPLSIVLIGVGLVILPTPVPIGAIMVAIGLALLVTVSPPVAGLVKGIRTRYPKLDDAMVRLEERVPNWLAVALRATNPNPTARKTSETGET